jgi:hypothetical protein
MGRYGDPHAVCKDLRDDRWCDHLHLIRADTSLKERSVERRSVLFFVIRTSLGIELMAAALLE